MNLKQIIVVCIALMIITPSFSFAIEAEPSGAPSGTSSDRFSPQDSFPSETSQNTKSDILTENFDPSFELSDLEEEKLDAALQEENLEAEELMEEMMTMSATTTSDPSVDLASLTAAQSAEFGFSKDAYLTSLFSGAAVYSYPIDVPKGIAGFQPKIDLTYNSQSIGGTYGWLGDGWSLNEYYILRDVYYTPNDISDDRFKLIFDGQSHDLIYSEADDFYHTEIETYMRIQREVGGSNQKGEYWTATMKDGTEYRFGYTMDSELLNSVSSRDYVSKWKLDQIKDVNGNLIEYNYVKNPMEGEVGTSYLKNISYNNGVNVIEFELVERAFSLNGYFDGNNVVEKSFLSKIKILADMNPVYVYNLNYGQTSTRQSLKSVTLVGSNNLERPTSFDYSQNERNFTYSNGTVNNTLFPSLYSNSISYAKPIDLNGNGLPDFLYSSRDNRNTTYQIWTNNGNGTFNYSNGTVNNTLFPALYSNNINYVHPIDLNGNGLSDFLYSSRDNRNTTYQIWMNNGDSTFTYSNGTVNNTLFPALYSNGINYAQTVDLNGNGLPDFLYSSRDNRNTTYQIWMNNGDGTFTYSNGTVNNTLFPALYSGSSNFARTIDLNGDGLTDFVYSATSNPNTAYQIWMNNGDNTFTYSNGSVLPIYFPALNEYIQTVDLNGDGLSDFLYSSRDSRNTTYSVWMNNGNGTFSNHSNGTVNNTLFPALYSNNINYAQAVDLNGEGVSDFLYSSRDSRNTSYQIWTNNYSVPGLLTQINHSTGAITKIEYDTSTKYNNTKDDGKQGLPSPIQIVKKVETDNGMQNDQKTVSTITYDYKGGFMHIEPKGKTEFRGFHQVTVTDERSIVEHYFHQDEVKKGNEYLTTTKSATDTLYSKTENNYIENTVDDVHEILLNNTSTSLYDGQITPIISKINYEYDLYGNAISIFNEGDLSISGDEKTITFDYTYNTSNWILNKVKKETIKDSNLQKVAEAEFYYDGYSDSNTPPAIGLMTKTISWNNYGNDIIKEFAYDSSGNLILQTDGNGHITTITYGTNLIFPASFTNALGQTTLLEYNLSIGKLEKITDPNGVETSMAYDGLGRITKVIKPGDSSASPTIRYQYFTDGQAPEYIKISTKKQGNDYYDMWNYYDGLLRTIKTESDSDIPSQKIISETYYDNYGSVSKIIAPRKGHEPALETVNQYDSFGRLIQTTNPDGSSRQMEYSQLSTILFDENGHKIQMDKDINGNIIKVTEFNGNEIYETGYEYDTLNQLIKIIPNQYYDQSNITFLVENSGVVAGSLDNTELVTSNLSLLGVASLIDTTYKVENTTFTYDSLGRQIAMDDPDLGIWTYTYTPTNKLATQTDARGVTIIYEYDALDRLILISYPNDDDVIYEYDQNVIGTLSKVQTEGITKLYSYDTRLRVVQETVLIEDLYETSRSQMFSMDPVIESNTLKSQSEMASIDTYLSEPLSSLRWQVETPAFVEFSEFNQSSGRSLDQSFEYVPLKETDLAKIPIYDFIDILTDEPSIYNQSGFELPGKGSDKQSISVLEFELDDAGEILTNEPSIYNQSNFELQERGLDKQPISVLGFEFDDADEVLTNELLIYNQMNGFELQETDFASRSSSIREIQESEIVYLSSGSGIRSETVVQDSFTNQQDITLQLEMEGFSVQQTDLANLRVSMGAGDSAYIYLNGNAVLKFVDSSSGGTLQIFDEAGNQLGIIAKVNGKTTAENMTFDVSFIQDGSQMNIEIQKYYRGVFNGTFSYSYMTYSDMSTLRAYIIGYQSNVDYISSQYTIYYEPLPEEPGEFYLNGFFENQQDITVQLEEEGYRVQELDLTNLRVSMGAGDSAYIYFNGNAILKFVDSGSGGTLQIFDENGNQLGLIAKVNGKTTAENMTFDVSFIHDGSQMNIEIQKYYRGVLNGTFAYSYMTYSDISTLRAHLIGYQSNVDYISSQYTIYYESLQEEPEEPEPEGPEVSDPTGSFENQQDFTLYFEKDGYRVQELDLTNLRISMGAGDVGYIHLNNREILRFVDSGSGGTLYIFDENGYQLGSISPINGKPSFENRTFDISFIHDGSVMLIEIQKYHRGVFEGTFAYSYATESNISTLRAYMNGYAPGVDYISGEYAVYYEELAPDTEPSQIEFFENGRFFNRADITIPLEKEGFYVQELDLTNLRFSMGNNNKAYSSVYLNGKEILRFSDTSDRNISVFDENGNLLGKVLPSVNGHPEFGNNTFDVSFIHDGSEMLIQIKKYTSGVPGNTAYFSYATDNEISTVRAAVNNGDASSQYEVYYKPLTDLSTLRNEEHILIPFNRDRNVVTELHLTDLKMSMGAHDIGYVYLNDQEFLRFIDDTSGGTLVIYDGNGHVLNSIQGVNGRTSHENVTFDISFVYEGDEIIFSVEQFKNGHSVDTFSYVCPAEKPLLYLQAYLDGYQSQTHYIDMNVETAYVPFPQPPKSDYFGTRNLTIPIAKDGHSLNEFNIRVGHKRYNDSSIIINNHDIIKIAGDNSTAIYNEWGAVIGTIPYQFGDSHMDVSIMPDGSDILLRIEKFKGAIPAGTYYYSYTANNITISDIKLRFEAGYAHNYWSGTYSIDYDLIVSDLPPHPIFHNTFENEEDITLHLDVVNPDSFYVKEVNLENLRLQPKAGNSASVVVDDLEILRLNNGSTTNSLRIFDRRGTEIGLISPVNVSSAYENVTFDVSIIQSTAEDAVLQLTIKESDTPPRFYNYAYQSNEPMSKIRFVVDSYASGRYFVSGSYDIKYASSVSIGDGYDTYSQYVTSYSYDSMDRITKKTLPNGKVITYNYNNQTLLSSIPGVIDNIEYNSMNLMTRKEFSNNVATDLTYDGWTKRLENINTPGLQNINYLFDPKGNVLGITDNIINENQYFFYDDLDRLILAGSENYSQSFAYNPLGSILAHRNKDVVTGDEVIFGFEYGNNAGIHAPTRVGETSLLYDANGNLIEDGSFVYVYNDANRLTEVLKKADNNRSIAQFIYDSSGSRIKKTEEGIVSYYISADYGIDDGEETVYYFANDNRVAKENSEGMFWYLDDHLGSTNVMIDESGQLVERTLYYPFGSHREGGEEKYSFTGKEFDSEIGLYYFEARYYNSEAFVFTQADSIIPNVYYPQALNRYAYCYNNPIIFVDPTGFSPVMLEYIAAKNNGAISYNVTPHYLWNTGYVYKKTVDITIDGKTTSYDTYRNNNVGGKTIVDSDWLVRDFNVDRISVEHQVGDVFESNDDTALAWALKYYAISNDRKNRCE